MHNINTKDKKKRAIKLFSAYGLIAIILIVTTYVLVLIAAGYDIDRKTGKVIQNGALLLETLPENAAVYVDDKLEKDKTPSRLPLREGEYDVRLELDEYRSWSSSVAIEGSKVAWLYYPQLIPNVINTSSLASLGKLGFIRMNHRGDVLATYNQSAPDSLVLYDLNKPSDAPQTVRIPLRLLNVTSSGRIEGTCEFIEWSDDGTYMLLRYTVNNKSEVLLVDMRNPNQSQSIDDSLGFAINKAFFGPDNNDVYIVHDNLLRAYIPDDASASTLLFEDVSQVAVDETDVWVMRSGNKAEQNGVFRLGRRDAPTISLDASQRKSLLAASYESKPSIALVGDDTIEIYTSVNENFEQNVPEKVIRFTDPEAKIVFSKDGRFLSVTQSNKTHVYDIREKRDYDITIDSTGMLGWLDSNRMYFSKDSQLYIVDFNGANTYQIASFESAWGAYIDEERRAIYTVGRQASTDRLVLHRSDIYLEDN